MRAINFYNYKFEKKDAKNFLLQYAKETDKEFAKTLKKFDEDKIPQTIGWVADMLMRGLNLVDPNEQIISRLDHMKKHPEQYIQKTETTDKRTKPKESIQTKQHKKFLRYLEDLDAVIDEFMDNGYNTTFKMKTWLSQNDIKKVYGKLISEVYKIEFDEIQKVVEKEDKELMEAYSFMKRSELKRYSKLLQDIYTTAESWLFKKKRKTTKKRKSKTQKKKVNSIKTRQSKSTNSTLTDFL